MCLSVVNTQFRNYDSQKLRHIRELRCMNLELNILNLIFLKKILAKISIWSLKLREIATDCIKIRMLRKHEIFRSTTPKYVPSFANTKFLPSFLHPYNPPMHLFLVRISCFRHACTYDVHSSFETRIAFKWITHYADGTIL